MAAYVGDLLTAEECDQLTKAFGCRPWSSVRPALPEPGGVRRETPSADVVVQHRGAEAREAERRQIEALMRNRGRGRLGGEV